MANQSIAATLLQRLSLVRSLAPESTNGGSEGNIGAFVLQHGGVDLGDGGFAASFMIRQEIREAVRDKGYEGLKIITVAVTSDPEEDESEHSDDGSPDYPESHVIYSHEIKSFEGEDAELIFPYFETKRLRNYDSEYLILNYAQQRIESESMEPGVLSIITELPPCNACTDVLQQFLENNPSWQVVVYYTKSKYSKKPPATVADRLQVVRL